MMKHGNIKSRYSLEINLIPSKMKSGRGTVPRAQAMRNIFSHTIIYNGNKIPSWQKP